MLSSVKCWNGDAIKKSVDFEYLPNYSLDMQIIIAENLKVDTRIRCNLQ